jgi:hypothetical protein
MCTCICVGDCIRQKPGVPQCTGNIGLSHTHDYCVFDIRFALVLSTRQLAKCIRFLSPIDKIENLLPRHKGG